MPQSSRECPRSDRRSRCGREFLNQEELDLTLKTLDGTPDKSRLGANAILATSLAFARATATHQGIELYNYFAALLPEGAPTLPRLSVNLFSGGKHAFGQVAIQDVLVVPPSGFIGRCKPGHDLRRLPDRCGNYRETIQREGPDGRRRGIGSPVSEQH